MVSQDHLDHHLAYGEHNCDCPKRVDLAQAKADYNRTQDPIYKSPHCTVPKHRLHEYERALSHMAGLLAEVEELRKKVKE